MRLERGVSSVFRCVRGERRLSVRVRQVCCPLRLGIDQEILNGSQDRRGFTARTRITRSRRRPINCHENSSLADPEADCSPAGRKEQESQTPDVGGLDGPREQPEATESDGALRKTKMGSTDSAASAHSGGSSCGLVSSLFPNSCRGRAESFARRLHRRLTSLGGEGNAADDAGRALVNRSTETSWLHASTGQRTTTNAPSNSATSLSSAMPNEERIYDCQPRHSPESDIFYDFDLDPTEHGSVGTISPAEIAGAAELAKILVNPKKLKNNHHEACHCSPGPRPPDFGHADQESGYVFSSPLTGLSPDTDNSELYFDPESSETEKSREETFHDPGGTSESDAASGASYPVAPSKICKFSGRRRVDRVDCDPRVEPTEKKKPQRNDNSESSSSSSNAGVTLEGARPPGIPVGCSSEESINGRSSLETTSPSHESLWSTFDDSTMSLQDESPTGRESIALPARLSKSHSDSEITGNANGVAEETDEVDSAEDQRAPEVEKIRLVNGETRIPATGPLAWNAVDLPSIGCLRLDESVDLLTDEQPTAEENGHISPDARKTSEMSLLVDRLGRSPSVELVTTEDTTTDDEDKHDADDKDEEDEVDRPQRVRRCSSLKTGKTPPGTPGRKKIVRFADVLGLDLADVRTFLDEIPKVPNSAYSDLIYDEAFQKDSSPVNFWGTGPATFTTPLFAATMNAAKGPMTGARLDRILVPLFQQPGGLANFLDLVRERQVCLENVVVQDPVTMCLQGTVRVRNLDFHKSVHVRYSLDSWRNFSDLQANYASNSCDGFSDKFTFSLYCHTLKIGHRLELAVRFQCKGAQYWDNNAGVNYCFQCLPATPANPGAYIPITATATSSPGGHHEWSPTFY